MRVLHTTPIRELGIAGARGIVVEVIRPDRTGIDKIMITVPGGHYHQLEAAAVQVQTQ